MKKSLVLTLGLFITLIGIMSCGGGADDEARQAAIRDSLRNDSIMQAQAAMALADSLRNDSIMMAQQAYADSLAAALAATGKAGSVKPKAGNTNTTTTTTTTTTTDPVKPLTGKDAIKGRDGATTTSGKDAIKNRNEGTGETKTTSGKAAIKNRDK